MQQGKYTLGQQAGYAGLCRLGMAFSYVQPERQHCAYQLGTLMCNSTVSVPELKLRQWWCARHMHTGQ